MQLISGSGGRSMLRQILKRGIVRSVSMVFLFLASCGGGGGEDKGAVALFITDNISFYKQVVVTINAVRLVNSNTQDSCTATNAPVTLDISNLALDTQLVDVGACAPGSYDRIELEFKQAVLLMDNQGDTAQCSFTSYLNEANQLKTLQCDPISGVCSLGMKSSVRKGREVIPVFAGKQTNLALDFDLKQFTVSDFGNPACAATMKVIPLDALAMNKSDRAQSATGKISLLDTVAQTFTISRGELYATVDYSGVIPALQPNLDIILQLAQNEGHRVKVLSAIVDPSAEKIAATHVYPIIQGMVSDFKKAPDKTFTLNYGSNYIPVDYGQASIDGALVNGTWVSLKLDGYDGTGHLATQAEVLPFGTKLEN